MKLPVFKSDGSGSTEKDFADFPSLEEGKGTQALRDYIIAYQANQRQGNACTKTRAEVSGTGKKPWRQKGTGMARAGSRRSPIFTGGGVVFGPRPRSYRQKIPAKIKTLAMKRALNNLAAEGSLNVIEKFETAEVKTKLFNDIVSKIRPTGKVLLVDDQYEDKVALSARNIERVFLTEAEVLNAWDLVRYDAIIISEAALAKTLQRLGGEANVAA